MKDLTTRAADNIRILAIYDPHVMLYLRSLSCLMSYLCAFGKSSRNFQSIFLIQKKMEHFSGIFLGTAVSFVNLFQKFSESSTQVTLSPSPSFAVLETAG